MSTKIQNNYELQVTSYAFFASLVQESPITIRPEDVPQMYAVCFNDQCPLFRQFRIVRLAWGFRTLFADVQKKDYDRLRSKVIFHFSSESNFWRYNCGYYKLTPEQQETILDIFRQHGYDPTTRRLSFTQITTNYP